MNYNEQDYLIQCLDAGIELCPRCGEPLDGEHLNCPPLREGSTVYIELWKTYHAAEEESK